MRYVSSQGMGGENPNIYVTLDKSKSIQTYEGLYALEECIIKMRKLQPLEPLIWSNEL